MTAKAAEGRDRTLLRLLYGSACRVSEAVGLNFGDLSRVSTEEGYGVVTFHGKGRKTRRVLVSLVVIDEVLALRQHADDDGPVFRNFNDGCRLTARSAQRIVAKSRTDVAGVTPHWMRHAHATHALDNGAPLHFVKDTLGHANISTTDIYVHVRGKQGSAPFVHAT
jgi:integrase/recombinase XerD